MILKPMNKQLPDPQLELFPQVHPLQPLIDSLADPVQMQRIHRLLEEIEECKPRQRRPTTFKVKNPDGSVYVPPRLSARQAVAPVARPHELRPLPLAVLD